VVLPKNPPQMNTDDTDLQIQSASMNFFDPCKSVLISVISGKVLVCAMHETKTGRFRPAFTTKEERRG
jgi:hypothetical protein